MTMPHDVFVDGVRYVRDDLRFKILKALVEECLGPIPDEDVVGESGRLYMNIGREQGYKSKPTVEAVVRRMKL